MKIHIAQKGDTLWNIAKKYHIDFEQLEKANSQLSSPGAIYPGMKIKVPVEKVATTNNQNRQATSENEVEEQLVAEAAVEEVEVDNESNEGDTRDEAEEFLARSDESPVPSTGEAVPQKHETQLSIEETLPPLPPYPTISKPPFSFPAPPPPIVNTNVPSSYGNHLLQKQEEAKIEQKMEEPKAPIYLSEQQKKELPQVQYMGDITQEQISSQAQAIGYKQPTEYSGKEGYFQGMQASYPGQQPYMYGGTVPLGYQPKAPCGCSGSTQQISPIGTGYMQGMQYAQGYPYGYLLPGVAYGYQGHPYAYQMPVAQYGYQDYPYEYQNYGVPYGYQSYGAPTQAYPYQHYAPTIPSGYQQSFSVPYYQTQETTPIHSQDAPTPAPVPTYPFPTTSFKGQGYPDYYRDETNTNFGVPPIDEED